MSLRAARVMDCAAKQPRRTVNKAMRLLRRFPAPTSSLLAMTALIRAK